MNPVAARRTQAGLPVVHGIHTLLWALETLVTSGYIVSPLVRFKVKFLKWVYLGDEAVLSLPVMGGSDSSSNPGRLLVDVLGMPVLSAELMYGEPGRTEPEGALAPSPAAPLPAAIDLSFAELYNRSGDAFTAASEDIQRFFPHLTAAMSARTVAEIAACSYIVGMEAPGLHSMFSRLDVTIAFSHDSPRIALHYLVIHHDERFRKARIAVTGREIVGTLEVFIRVPPVEQASMEEVAAQVKPLEFAGINALIIGGSRGLGEVTAKLIAAGGGNPTITYVLGKAEAERVAEQIRDAGGNAQVLRYDVRAASGPQIPTILPTIGAPYTHLFYFATSTIYKPKQGVLSPSMLAEFTQFYLQGFYDLCTALTSARSKTADLDSKLIVFYPSTVFLEERPAGMTEYAMVKAAGEQLCRDMNQYLSNLHILTTRLPRLLTDQTAGVLPERELDHVRILLPIVREMRRLSNNPLDRP